MIKRKIMEKKVLFVLAFAMLFVGKRHLYSMEPYTITKVE
jgi:hypothetical protein